MKLWTIGVDFRSAPLELRGKLAHQDWNKIAKDWSERIWISTCNRAELYGVGEEDGSNVAKRWAEACGLSAEEIQAFRIYQDDRSLSHLFRVASSIESMVVGETQITGQLKKAYELAVQEGLVGPILHRSFQRAFKVAKQVRSQTEVGRLAVSIPSIGVKLAEKVLGDLTHFKIGVVGLGEIGRVAAEHFASVQPKRMFLYNRTTSVAVDLQERMKVECAPIEVMTDLNDLVQKSDVIVSSADARVIDGEMLQKIDHRGRPVFILDLSVPPSVERGNFPNLFLYSIDDLEKIAAENNELRLQEMEKAEEIIEAEVKGCLQSFGNITVSQTFGMLASKIDSLTQAELQELRNRLPHLSDKDWAEIEKSAYRLTSKVVQDPMMELKTKLRTAEDNETFVQFFRNLFRI